MTFQIKRAFLLSLVVFLSVQLGYSIHSISISIKEKSGIELIKDELSIEELINKDRQQIEEQIGVKLTFKEKLTLRIIQRSVRKAIKKGQSKEAIQKAFSDNDFTLHPIGFFLGLLLLPIGVLITYLFIKKNKKAARKSAWIGFGAMVGLFLLVVGLVVLFLNSFFGV